MTDNEKLSCLIDRPCTACKFHKEEGCSKWSCVFEDKSGDTEGEYIKIDDLDDTVLRLNNDGWEITRNEHKLISNVLYEMPLYSFPDREKGDTVSRVAYEQIMWERDVAIQQLKDLGYGLGEKPKENKGEWINTEEEGQYKCNNCGKICGFKKDKTYGYYVAEDLCPNCGADMRGKAE